MTSILSAEQGDPLPLQKCMFIMNALENGWSVRKRRGSYVFSKKHEGKKEILRDGYLARFLEENMEVGRTLESIYLSGR